MVLSEHKKRSKEQWTYRYAIIWQNYLKHIMMRFIANCCLDVN